MRKQSIPFLLASGLLYAISNVALAEATTTELRAICDAEREKLIAPLRQQAINECNKEKRNTKEYCERFYADFGAAIQSQQGFRQRMFHDIPECLALYDAENNENRDTSRDTEPGKNRDSTTVDNNRDTESGKNRDAAPNRQGE